MSDEPELPEAPFIAARFADTPVYHTERCVAVKRSTRPLRSVSDDEVKYHSLTHCQYCSGAFAPGERRTQQDILDEIGGVDL